MTPWDPKIPHKRFGLGGVHTHISSIIVTCITPAAVYLLDFSMLEVCWVLTPQPPPLTLNSLCAQGSWEYFFFVVISAYTHRLSLCRSHCSFSALLVLKHFCDGFRENLSWGWMTPLVQSLVVSCWRFLVHLLEYLRFLRICGFIKISI